LTTRIQNPDSQAPTPTRTEERTYVRSATRSRPYSNTPRKTASKKNAIFASNASGPPISSPAIVANCGKFVPNWKLIGIPVTVPITKPAANTFTQNERNRAYCCSLVRTSFQVK